MYFTFLSGATVESALTLAVHSRCGDKMTGDRWYKEEPGFFVKINLFILFESSCIFEWVNCSAMIGKHLLDAGAAARKMLVLLLREKVTPKYQDFPPFIKDIFNANDVATIFQESCKHDMFSTILIFVHM